MVNPINIYYDSVCEEKIYQNYDYIYKVSFSAYSNVPYC